MVFDAVYFPMKVIQTGSTSSPNRIAQACDRCRSKKIKCNGDFPTCGQCQSIGFQCKTSDKLRRKAFPRGYTQSLEERVRKLESENNELKQQLDKREEKIDLLSKIHAFKDNSRRSPSAKTSQSIHHKRVSQTGDEGDGERGAKIALQLPTEEPGSEEIVVQRTSRIPAITNSTFSASQRHETWAREGDSLLYLASPEDPRSRASSSNWYQRSDDAALSSSIGRLSDAGLSEHDLLSSESTQVALSRSPYGTSNPSSADMQPASQDAYMDRVCQASLTHASPPALTDLGRLPGPAPADLGHLALGADSSSHPHSGDVASADPMSTHKNFPLSDLSTVNLVGTSSSAFALMAPKGINAFPFDMTVATADSSQVQQLQSYSSRNPSIGTQQPDRGGLRGLQSTEGLLNINEPPQNGTIGPTWGSSGSGGEDMTGFEIYPDQA